VAAEADGESFGGKNRVLCRLTAFPPPPFPRKGVTVVRHFVAHEIVRIAVPQ
jgi:hypothetical protein